MSNRIARNLRRDFYSSVINKDIAFFDERKTGDLRKYSLKLMISLVSRINSDIQVIQDCLSVNVSEFARTTLFIIGALTILIVLSPILAGAVFSSILPIMIFGFFYGRKIRKLQKEIQEEKAKMTNVAEESYGNIRTVKAFSNE